MKQLTVCLLLFLFLFLFTAISRAQSRSLNLFDGKTLNGWKVAVGNATYEAKDGMIVGTSTLDSINSFLVTEEEFDDFILELEVMIDDTISNSGVQLRSHFNPAGNKGRGQVFGYQCEFDPAPRRWTGGIYDEARREWLYPLTLNPGAQNAFRLGVFNKIKVECIGNSIRTWVNGQPVAYVIDDLDKKGFIALQVHGNKKPESLGKKVYWKNIKLTETTKTRDVFPASVFIVNTIPNDLSSPEKKQGWKLLFDGKTTKGWKGAYKDQFPEKGWEIKDGTLNVQPSTGGESTNGGDIVTNELFSAFDLTFEFKLTAGANSGVKYFVTLSENNTGSAIGLEYQLLDDTLHPDAKMGRDGNRTLSSLYDLIKADKQKRFIKKIGEWNTARIIVYPNNHVEHYLNGMKVLEYERGSQPYRDLVAISKYKVWNNFGEAKEGRILLQDHGNAVSFRSIKIRKLK